SVEQEFVICSGCCVETSPFGEREVGMPKLESVHLHNPSADETVTLLSISATTSHFHASFFQNRVIPPGGNTSFDVVFLARVVGNVENTLFINTSRHGAFTYQVFGVGVPNPYRLRPFLGARVPVNSSFSPLINMHNPHSKPLQVVEIYSTGGDLHLELPTGQAEGPRKLWEIPPFETKAVMRASFISREPHNHTAFIRIKTNDSDDYLILPMEVEVTTAPGIYSSTEMLDFGTLRSQDPAKTLNLYLLNSGAKDVPITLSPANTAISIDFKPLTLKAFEKKYTKVASVIYDPSKARRISQHSGKILVKAKEKSYPKLEIAYQVDLLEGYLGYDQAATLFQTYDGQIEPQTRPVSLTNTFNITIVLHDVTLPEEVQHLFQVKNFSRPLWIAPQETCYAFSLSFAPVGPLTNLEANVLLSTNASRFHLPFHVYTGFVDHLSLSIPHSFFSQILTIPVKAVVAVGTLVSQPQHILLSPSFPGKLVVHPVSLASSFSRGVRVEAVRPPTNSSYFFFRRLRHAKEELEPGKTSKIDCLCSRGLSKCELVWCEMFLEWLGVPSAVQGLRLDLPPGEQRVVSLGFAPTNNLTISSLVLIRNNLTILDGIVVSGQGVSESLRLGGKVPSPNSSLRFKVTESFLRDCTDKSRSKQPNFTLTRTFKMENPGPLDLRVMSIAVNDYSCEGYGFHVLNCEAFTLKANSSREFSIAFTPDFTASRVIRELRVRTARDSEFSFVLNASLPYHMLATCSEALPRPNWEGLLYIAVFSLRRESDCTRLREEEQRDGLADNDDSSSTTTEASNPDLELAARAKLAKILSLPGRNGNPTFAAVAAGHDKTFGKEKIFPLGTNNCRILFLTKVLKTSFIVLVSFTSPPAPSPTFSAFGPSNSFDLTGGMSCE
uniref:Transmembrane protein 131 n=1 Tax=Eptatretus burgeri TaxID=7764 RepID=A0A8C4QRV2_EPTBU